MKFVKILLLTILFAGLAFLWFELSDELDTIEPFVIQTEKKTESPGQLYYDYQQIENNIHLIELSPEKLHYIYDPNRLVTIEEYIEESEFELAINSQYFTPENTIIGFLQSDGMFVNELSSNNQQLTHIAYFTPDNELYFTEANSNFSPNEEVALAFQSGPLFVLDGTITENYILGSLNGFGRYRRSFIGKIEGTDRIFIGITTSSYSLEELGKRLIQQYEGETISVLNLDGGSSIALYSGENKNFRFGESKKLPLVLLLK